MIQQFCKEYFGVAITWVYLEAGHGKGTPDGIGATAKRGIDNLMGDNPTEPIYTVEDLLDHGYEAYVPSLTVLKHTPDEVEGVLKSIPDY